jgi:hypothetical protein
MQLRFFTTLLVAVLVIASSLSALTVVPIGSDLGLIIPASAAPPFSGGNGSANNPFQISNVSQLQNMSGDLTAHYILINDIYCSETKTWNSGKGFFPIGGDTDLGTGGFQGSKFTGSLNGQGHKITDIYINQPGYNWVGFFGWVEVGGELNNVSLKNISVNGEGRVGGFVGYNKGIINNCGVQGSVIGDIDDSWNVGGLVGENLKGIISHCYTDCVVDSYEYGGGLVGYNDGWINHSYSTGPMTGTGSEYIGGLVGYNPGTINNSYAKGAVISTYNSVGGLVGDTFGYVFNSYATGSVKGNQYVGGFAGESIEVIRNCYATGDVNGVVDVGGFAGYNVERINNSYSTGGVKGNSNVGGFIGWQGATAITTGCYFDNITSGNTKGVGGGTSGGTTGKNTTDMKKQATFQPASWDFVNIWSIIEDGSYPFLWPFYNNPQLTTKDLGSATEDTKYSKDLEAYYSNYPQVNYIDWSFNTNTGIWLTLDSNGKLSGTPSNYDVGTPWIEVTITDLIGESDTYNYTFTIFNVNDPPMIETANIENATEDVLYSIDYNATDIDLTSDVLTWNISTTADWLAFNSTTGNLTGTPENEDVGCYWVKIDIDDGVGGSNSTEFFLEVSNVNDDPIITTSQVTTNAFEDKLYVLDFDAIDVDPTDDVLSWNIDTDAIWLTFNKSTGVLFGTPKNSDVGEYNVNITVTDDKGGIAWVEYQLKVKNVNDAPVIITLDITTAQVGELYLNQYNATDIDPTGDTLSWSLNTDAGAWLSINTSSGLLSGTPDEGDDGTYWVKIMVSDDFSETDFTNFTLKVEPKTIIPPEENKNPEITTKDVKTAEVDKEYSMTYEATDDRTNILDLIWTSETNASWLEFNPVTRILIGTPIESDIGIYWVEIAVIDDEDGSDSTNFTITVSKPQTTKPEPKNNPPIITQVTEEQKAKAGEEYSVKINGEDKDDGDIITFTLQDGPTGMVISKEGKILWLPQDNQVGIHTVVVTLSDGKNSTTMSFDVIIEEATKDEPDDEDEESEKEFSFEEGLPYLFILLIIGLIIGLLIGLAMRRKPATSEEIGQDHEIEEEELEELDEVEEEEIKDEDLEEEDLEDEKIKDDEELEE